LRIIYNYAVATGIVLQLIRVSVEFRCSF